MKKHAKKQKQQQGPGQLERRLTELQEQLYQLGGELELLACDDTVPDVLVQDRMVECTRLREMRDAIRGEFT